MEGDMSDAYRKQRVRRYGARGSEMRASEYEEQDLDSLEKRVVEVDDGFCVCGSPLTGDKEEVYRCSSCDTLCCHRCQVEISLMHLCPECAARDFRVDKTVFQLLLLADHGIIPVEGMVEVEVLAGGITEVRVDEATTLLSDRGFVSVEEGVLTPTGREAFHVADQIWGEDSDVQELKQRIRVAEVVHR